MRNELWAEPAKPRRNPIASLGGLEAAQHLHFPPAQFSKVCSHHSAVETDLDAKFECGIFQTARKSDGLVMMSWKMLGLEKLSQAARSEAIVLSS